MRDMFDVCVVGSGPAGAFVANSLAKKNKKVLLLEAGNFNLSSNVNDNFDIDNSNIKGSVDFGFSQQVGGSSNLWAGGLGEMNAIDIEERIEFNFLSWPVSYDHLKDLYRRVKETIDYDYLSHMPRNVAGIELREMMMMDKPYNTKNLIKNVKNLTLLQNHTVCKLNIKSKNSSVESITAFNTKTLEKVDLKATEFIMAAGAVNNIRVLLHSLKEFKLIDPNFYNSIGAYFSTHPKGNVGKIKFNKKFNKNNPLTSIYPNNTGFTKYYFGLEMTELKNENLLNHCLRIESIYAIKMGKVLDYFKLIFSWIPFISKNPFFLNLIVKFGISLFKFAEKLSPTKSFDGKFMVRGFFDQKSKKENRVSLSPKKSLSGLPLAKINWEFTEEDWDGVSRFMKTMQRKLKENNVGDLDYSRPKDDDFTGIHSHFIGGTRIGDSPSNSVVDKNLKVHYLDNLYLSGPSVFPSYGYANPFLSIAAMSLRLADHIINKKSHS